MFCPNCNTPCDDQIPHCMNCGCPLTVAEIPRKGRHWVPILVMVILVCFCTSLFFLMPGTSGFSSKNLISSDMPWFTLDDGVLHFRESYYNGSAELVIPETISGMTVTAISQDCFKDCTYLTAVHLPDTLEAIGEGAFRGCNGLRGISIPESVSFIGRNAFSDCSALEAVQLFDQLKHIGSGTFDYCNHLHYIFFSGDFQVWAELYEGIIPPNATICCANGNFDSEGNPS